LPYFSFGSLEGAPVSLHVAIARQPFDMSARAYVEMARVAAERTELTELQLRRRVQPTYVGMRPALRIDTESSDGFETRLELSIDGHCVWVRGQRTRWAGESVPPIWDGIEARVAASLHLVHE
jgi:hypothetical protein